MRVESLPRSHDGLWPMRDHEGVPVWMDFPDAFQRLVRIAVALTNEPDLDRLLELILREARNLTTAEAGTLFLRDGDRLRFAVVQNDRLTRVLGETEMRRLLRAQPLSIWEESLAGYVAVTGELINVPDTEMIPPRCSYAFYGQVDERTGYHTRSVLAAPLVAPSPDGSSKVVGVLQLINALDELGSVVPFDLEYEALVRALASQAAAAILLAQRG